MSKNLIQGELRPELFNELLNGRLSTRIAYARADLCPCSAQRSSGSPDPKCPVCGALGYTWEGTVPELTRTYTLTRDPLPSHAHRERLPNPSETITSITDERGTAYPPEAVQVMPDGRVRWLESGPAQYDRYTVTTQGAVLRAGVQGVMARREFQVRGEYDVLDLSMTIDRHLDDGATLNPAWDCGESDRFVLLDAWRRHAQKIVRSGPSGDQTLYRNMRGLRLSSIQNGARRVWAEGQDYTFTDGTVTWAAGHGPAQGATYAVQGEANPEYYVFKALPQVRQQDGKPLPRVIVLKGFEHFPNRKPDQPVR